MKIKNFNILILLFLCVFCLFGCSQISELKLLTDYIEKNIFAALEILNNKKNILSEKVQLEYKINLFDKLALPITTFALALIGIPLAITPPRVRYNRGFLFSILIIFVY